MLDLLLWEESRDPTLLDLKLLDWLRSGAFFRLLVLVLLRCFSFVSEDALKVFILKLDGLEVFFSSFKLLPYRTASSFYLTSRVFFLRLSTD